MKTSNQETSLNKQIGSRFKLIRKICNEGTHYTSKQFSYLLGITDEQLHNYESGRSALPIELLIELYHRGINPLFLLGLEPEMFATNSKGNELKSKIN